MFINVYIALAEHMGSAPHTATFKRKISNKIFISQLYNTYIPQITHIFI